MDPLQPAPSTVEGPAPSMVEGPAPSSVEGPAPSAVEGPNRPDATHPVQLCLPGLPPERLEGVDRRASGYTGPTYHGQWAGERADPSAGWQSHWLGDVLAWCRTLASSVVYATLIVTFGFQVARVEGQSMAPTLTDQDRLIVNKFAYRIGEPRRNDIVMLLDPANPDQSFVKRIIAEEGDEVRILDGRVHVNGVPLPDDYVPAEYRGTDDYGPYHVQEGYYFVLGDHRNSSSDSRHWGPVPKKYVLGKVQLRWWPIPNARLF